MKTLSKKDLKDINGGGMISVPLAPAMPGVILAMAVIKWLQRG